MPGFYYISYQLELASKLARDGSLEAARISTKSIHTVVEGISKIFKELECRVTLEGYWVVSIDLRKWRR
jgi:hypothetical protein